MYHVSHDMCHVLHVTRQVSHIVCCVSQPQTPSLANSPTIHSRLVCKDQKTIETVQQKCVLRLTDMSNTLHREARVSRIAKVLLC